MRHYSSAGKEWTREICLQLSPRIIVGFGHGAEIAPACVIYQDVKATERADRRRYQPIDVATVRDIYLHGQRLRPCSRTRAALSAALSGSTSAATTRSPAAAKPTAMA